MHKRTKKLEGSEMFDEYNGYTNIYVSATQPPVLQKIPNKPPVYQIGSIRLEGITPSDSFLEFAEKERLGLATDEDIMKVCPTGYYVPKAKVAVK